jgi:N6-adenosine-specific RNA methylase IME4
VLSHLTAVGYPQKHLGGDDDGGDGLDEYAEFLDGLEAYASSVWEKVNNPKPVRRGRRAQSALRVPEPLPPDTPALPPKQYRIIYSDPAWKGVGAEKHYPTMSVEQMAQIDVPALNHPEGTTHFMWAVSSLMPEAMTLMKAWGYEYKTIAFVWVKTHGDRPDGKPWLAVAQGPYARGSAEVVLVGRSKGKMLESKDRTVRQVVIAERGRHSAKPAEVRDRIVRLFAGEPRLEMFAREDAPGWDSWGNQVPGDTPEEASSVTSKVTINNAVSGVPYLVRLDEQPPRIRRSIYSDVIKDFAAKKNTKYAKVTGMKPTAIVSLKRTILRLGLTDVTACTVNGEVILERKKKKSAKKSPSEPQKQIED